MRHPCLIPCLPALGAALLLAACGGEGGSGERATSAAAPAFSLSYTSSSTTLMSPEQNPRAMAGYPDLGNTGYANSALKFLIHSIGPQRLTRHLGEFAQRSDKPHQAAAQGWIQLIENTYSEREPTPQELTDFFNSLQQLPEFKDFTIVGTQDAEGFMTALSQSLALHEINAGSIALRDGSNASKSDGQYWTTLQSASSDDSLQAVFDRTPPADWRFEPRKGPQYLTVKLDDSHHAAPSHRNFDFNQTVQLQITNGDLTETLVLEPREVMAFSGIDNAGHYVFYAKDAQWVRYDDEQVTVLTQMPSIENVRFINFVIQSVESRSETSSGAAPAIKMPVLRFGSDPKEEFPAWNPPR